MSNIAWRRLLQPKTLFAWDDIQKRSSATSWLDGLRGVSALQVFFFHFFGRHTEYGHTFGSTDKDWYVHQLPLFRPIWAAGNGAVSTFFIISGYAITFKSLSLLRQQNYDALYTGLSSSVFRRGFRLFLPVILLALPTFVLLRIFDFTDGFAFSVEIKSSTWLQVLDFFEETDHLLNPFSYRISMSDSRYLYVPTSWTIPMEYYGSIVCYVVLLIVARVHKYWLRSLIIGGFSVYAIHQGSWFTSNFLFGMWMADATLEHQVKHEYDERSKTRQRLMTALYLSMFLFGLYLQGMPPETIAFDFAPAPKIGYMWLYKLYPPKWLVKVAEDARWYWYLSGVLIFTGVNKIAQIQAVFNTKFCRWLGKLSFSLYLVHAAVIALLSRPLQSFAKTFTEHRGFISLFDFVIVFPIVIVLSGIAERLVDRPSVRFAKWLEGQVFEQKPRSSSLELLERPLMANGHAESSHVLE